MYDIQTLYEAGTVAEAITLRLAHPEARIIAGGSDVLVQLRSGKLAGCELISIHGIDEMRGIVLDAEENVRIGSLTSFRAITNDPIIQKFVPVLGEAVDKVGSPQIRSIGTIGGNTCNGVTSADSASTLFALDAVVELTGSRGVRRVPIADFYLGAGRVDLRAEEGELQTAILIPRESYDRCSGHYEKYGMRNAMEIATLGVSVNVRLSADGTRIERCRAACGVAGPIPLRVPAAEAMACNAALTAELPARFGAALTADIHPRDSWRASKVFREHIAAEMARRCLIEAVQKAGGEWQ